MHMHHISSYCQLQMNENGETQSQGLVKSILLAVPNGLTDIHLVDLPLAMKKHF